MAKKQNPKCEHCSLLSMKEVHELHGGSGDGCWDQNRCRSKRYHYQNAKTRINQMREKRGAKPLPEPAKSVSWSILNQTPVAIVLYYRENSTSDVHAIAAELWQAGKRLRVAPAIHTFGLTQGQVKKMLLGVLETFSKEVGHKIEGFGSAASLKPTACPLKDCPLRSEGI